MDMTKTPDEIKKGLECCSKGLTWDETCGTGCPYEGMGYGECSTALSADALALIQKKEQENSEQTERIRVLERRNNALYHTLLGVMHFVDKWLDVPAYDPDEDLNGTTAVGRASHAREIALQAIEQLESKLECSQMTIDGLTATLLKCDAIIKQLEAERDAAVGDIKRMVQDPYEPAYCEYCKKTEEECEKTNCWRRDQFEWRGVQGNN